MPGRAKARTPPGSVGTLWALRPLPACRRYSSGEPVSEGAGTHTARLEDAPRHHVDSSAAGGRPPNGSRGRRVRLLLCCSIVVMLVPGCAAAQTAPISPARTSAGGDVPIACLASPPATGPIYPSYFFQIGKTHVLLEVTCRAEDPKRGEDQSVAKWMIESAATVR